MIRRIIRLALILLLIITAGTAYVSTTRTGLVTLIDISSALIPGTLQAKVKNGYLLGNMHLTNITYQYQNITITAKDLQLHWHIKQFSNLTLAIPYLKIDDFIIKDTAAAQHSVYGFSHLTTTGILQLPSLRSHLVLTWQNMFVPVNPSFSVKLPKGQLLLTGPLLHYHAMGGFQTAGRNFPKANWQLISADGNFSHVHIHNLISNALQGQITVSGDIAWAPHVKWDAHIRGTRLNPAASWSMPAGTLLLHIHSQGLLTDTSHLYQFELKQLQGTLGDYPVQGIGNIAISNDDYQFQQLAITVDNATLKANGKVTPQVANLTWQINAENLSRLWAQATGSIHANGQMHGSMTNPQILATVKANNVLINNYQIGNLNADIDGYPLSLTATSKVNIIATQVGIGGGQLIQKLVLSAINQQNRSQLQLQLANERMQLSLQLIGSIIKNQWQGVFKQFSLNLKEVGEIHLQKPTPLTFNQHGFALEPFCFVGSLGNTCVQTAKFTAIPGMINDKDEQSPTKIDGALQLVSQDLAFITVFLPELSKVQGKLVLNFQMSGTTTAPNIAGKATLTNASFTVPRLGLQANAVGLNIDGTQNSLQYTAQATIGNGQLQLNGNTNLSQEGFPTTITARGNNLLIANNYDAKVIATPDLKLQYQYPDINVTGTINIPQAALTPRDLTSTITLPKDVVFVTPDQTTPKQNTNFSSRIEITLGDAIHVAYAGLVGRVTGNIIVQDKPGGDTTATGTIAFVDGTYKAYGQDLVIRQGKLIFTGGPVNNPGLNIQAVRQLQIVSAAINTKSATTAGAYSTNQQAVGVNITGTLAEPKSILFSEPPGLSQSDIIAYLITGQPASKATSQSAPSILQALSLLNLSSGTNTQLKDQFKNMLGLDQFGISKDEEYDKETNSVVQNTSLLLGKALSPRLFLNYSLGLTEPINIISIVYKLTNHISLQSEHSTNATGIDIFYTIEKN
jgi:autotransporter translocation and assembly factor TamB